MDIEKLLEGGESDTLDFKESFDRRAKETVGAFSNTIGGIILLGVGNHGEVIGLTVGKNTLSDIAHKISDATDPTVIPEVEALEHEEKTIVLIRIKEFPLKPVSVRGRCYRRVGDSTRQMTSQEIAEMHLHSTGSSWDALSARGKTLEDIDIENVRRYIRNANATGRRNLDIGEDPLKVLEKLELVKDDKPTWAAVLLFGRTPQSPLVQAAVHCGRFKEDVVIIDDRLIRGTIVDQVNEVMDFMRKNTNVRFVITGKPQRDEIWDYPLDALREAVLNAICHRDYADSAEIQIKIHDDRLTIWSPGLLPPGITLKELYEPDHSSKPRNKLIAQVFYDTGWIEKYGSGIQRITNLCAAQRIPAPVFEESSGGVRVTFKRFFHTEEELADPAFGLNERQVKAVMYVQEHEQITNREYREMFNISERSALNDLAELCEKEVFVKIGTTGKYTKYVLDTSHNPKSDG